MGTTKEDLESLLSKTQQAGGNAEDMFEKDFVFKRT
jgi:hypothetical protein